VLSHYYDISQEDANAVVAIGGGVPTAEEEAVALEVSVAAAAVGGEE